MFKIFRLKESVGGGCVCGMGKGWKESYGVGLELEIYQYECELMIFLKKLYFLVLSSEVSRSSDTPVAKNTPGAQGLISKYHSA